MIPSQTGELLLTAAKSSLTPIAILLLLGLFILRGIMLAAVLPPFEGWDEYQHLGYIDHVANADAPVVFGQTTLEERYVQAVAQFPQPDAALPVQMNAATYADYWKQSARSEGAQASIPLYEAQHPVIYYWLMAPIYRASGGRSNLIQAVSMLRLINLALGAGALLMVLLWIRRNLSAPATLPVALWVAFQPLLLLNVVRVANDALAYFLGTAVVVIAVSSCHRRVWLGPFLLALLLPLAVLTKLNNLALVPWVFAVLILQNPRLAPMKILPILIVLVLATARYFFFNLHNTGILAPMQEAVINHQTGRRFFDVLFAVSPIMWLRWARGWWIANAMWVGGWSFLRLPPLFTVSYEILLEIAGFALIAAILRRRQIAIKSTQLFAILGLLVFVELAMLFHGLESYSALAGRLTTNPWYAAVATPWWMILLASGAIALPWRRWTNALLLALPLLCYIGEIYGLVFTMIPFYSASSSYVTALGRLAELHPAILGTSTLLFCAILSLSLMLAILRIYKTSVARG